MWVRCGISGYVYCFEIYQRKEPARISFSATENVVLRLCHDLAGKNHKVYVDNFFSSIPLVQKLKEDGIYYMGIVRSNRLQGTEKHLRSVKELKKLGRGQISVATSSDDITVTRWMDNSIVNVVSTYAGVEPVAMCRRFSHTTQT